MPEVIDDTKREVSQNWKGGLAYGLGIGFGQQMLGPIGHAAGGTLAGAYVGGDTGNAMTSIAMGEGLAMLLNSGGNSQTGSGRNRV